MTEKKISYRMGSSSLLLPGDVLLLELQLHAKGGISPLLLGFKPANQPNLLHHCQPSIQGDSPGSFFHTSTAGSKASKPTSAKRTRFSEDTIETPCVDPHMPKHEAAVKLQKVYKSFRTRRQLADCAVLVEQRWWKLLDFAMLKRSYVSFFDIKKPESAVSKWSRARTRAAKVGKGLSKNAKA